MFLPILINPILGLVSHPYISFNFNYFFNEVTLEVRASKANSAYELVCVVVVGGYRLVRITCSNAVIFKKKKKTKNGQL